MHELAPAEDLVDLVTTETDAARVHVVRLRVGRQACASPDALCFCFDDCVLGRDLFPAPRLLREGGR